MNKENLESLKAFVPVEVLAFFIFVDNAIDTSILKSAAGTWRTNAWVAVILFVVALVATVLVSRIRYRAQWRKVATISCLAFLIWSYSIQSKYLQVFDWEYSPAVAALSFGIFTLATAFIQLPANVETEPVQDDAEN